MSDHVTITEEWFRKPNGTALRVRSVNGVEIDTLEYPLWPFSFVPDVTNYIKTEVPLDDYRVSK